MDKSIAIEAVYKAIDDVNETLPNNRKLKKSTDEAVFGKDGKLDSVGLVNFIVSIESVLEDDYDLSLSLANEKAMSQSNSPFRSVDSLADYICTLSVQ